MLYRVRNLSLFLVLLLGIFSMWAATINVPGDYATIPAAIIAAATGDEIVLQADFTILPADYMHADYYALKVADKELILDLNGYNISSTANATIYISSTGSLTLKDTSVLADGIVINNSPDEWNAIGNYGHFTMLGGNLNATYFALYNYYYSDTVYGTATISGGTLTGAFEGVGNCGIMTVSGGSFHGTNYYDIDNSGQMNLTQSITFNSLLLRDGSDAPNVPGSGSVNIPDGVNVFGETSASNMYIMTGTTINAPVGNTLGLLAGDTTEDFELYWNPSDNMWQTKVVNVTSRLNYNAIQPAINTATAGDVINVAAGNYDEHVIINKAISLLGPNANISAVDGTRVPEAVIGQYITVNNGAGLSDVIIAGFEFNETDALHSIIMIGGNTEDVQILNNRFINIPWKAIYTEAGANVTNLDMIISGNLISGVSGTSESGIYLINHTGGTISNNKIENTVYGGILINTYCHGMTISNNQIYNVPQQGLQLSGDVADVTVSGNIIDHANTAEVSDKGGIRLYASDFTGPVLITGNTISNSYNGIAVKDGYGSLSPAQQEWIQIRNNDLSGNVCGVYMPADGSDYLDAEENWWGDPAGPTLRNGVGVTAHVLFDPWWADEAMTILDSNMPVENTIQHTFYATIQAAIDAATAGDVINVAAGLYQEDVVINKDLSLLGAKSSIPRNTGSSTDWTTSTTATWDNAAAVAAGESVIRSINTTTTHSVIDIAENCNVVLKGFVIEARNRTDGTNRHLVCVIGQDATIQNVTIENNIIGPITGLEQNGAKGRMGLNFDSQRGGLNGLSGSVKNNKIFGAEGNGNNVFLIGSHYNPSFSNYSGMTIEHNDIYGTNRVNVELCGGLRGLTLQHNYLDHAGYIWSGTEYVMSAASIAAPTKLNYGIGITMIRTGVVVTDYTLETQNRLEDLTVDGNTITNSQKMGIYSEAMIDDVVISQNSISGSGWRGIWLDESGTFNATKANAPAYGYTGDIAITGNTITDNSTGILVTGKPPYFNCEMNTIAGNTTGMTQEDGTGQTWVYAADATHNWWGDITGPLHPDTNPLAVGNPVSDDVLYDPWYISSDMDETDSNAPVENVTQNLFSYTIQSAIDTAVESDVIVINGGTYNENLVIDTPLTLMPSGRDPVVINGTGTGSVITVAADGVEITGLTIQGSGSELTDAGIYIMAHNNTNIHGNVIQNNASGILLAYGTGNHFTANEIHNNALYGIGLVAAVANTIDDNNIYNIGYDGIALENLNKLTEVEGDKIFGSVLNTISENDVTAAQDGLFIGFNCDNNAITNNVFEATESAVHLWRGGNQTITGNTLTGAEIGLRLKASNDNTIQNNTITGNEVGLNTGGTLDYGPSEDNLIIQNRIYGNSVYGAQTLEGSPLDLTRNYWGSQYGPEHATNPFSGTEGIGNAVTTNVTYDPWWINEEMTILSTDVTLSLSTPEHLVKDLETQPFAVTLAQVEDLRGFNVQIKVPKIDYAIPTNFAIGPSFAAGDNTLFTLDSSDNDYWMIDVTGSYDGVARLDGPNLVLFTFDLTTLADASNLTGSQIELPLAQVLMYNEMNHYIPCAGTTGEIVIIDSGEPTMIQQPENATAYPSGMLLLVDPAAPTTLIRPTLNYTYYDDYNLGYSKYLIYPLGGIVPTTIADFATGTDMDPIDNADTAVAWQLPEIINSYGDGSYVVYFLIVDDAGNLNINTWSFEIDKTVPATPLWTSCLTTVDGANSVDLVWTGDAAKYDIWVLNYDDLTDAGGYPLYNPAAFGTPAIPAAPNAYNPDVQNGWTRLENDLVGTTYTHIPADRGYYYYYIFAEDLAGNYSPVSEMRESISYWPGDVNETPDGLVNSDDIVLLGSVWGQTAGISTYDVGPSIGRLRRGRPTPDGRINIEDLMMFSMNYMNTNYTAYTRSTNDSKPDPVRIDIEQEILGNELIVRLILSENNGLVKGLNIPLEIGSGLELQSVTAGTIWNEESILLHTNEQGKVELSGSNLVDCIAENGLVATLSFKISGQNTELALKHMIARAFDNSDIEIIDNPQDAPSGDDDPEIIIPATSFLGANYPNPFNPTTTISFGLNETGNVKLDVFNSRGQLVRTLINGTMQAGLHNVVWNGMDDSNRPLGSGIYFIKMQTRNLEQTTRAIMVK